MRIRVFRAEDAKALAKLMHASVREAGLRNDTLEQVIAWSPCPPDLARYVQRGQEDRTVLVAANDADEPIAYGDLKADGHIDHLDYRPDAVGKGVASALYDELEAAARQLGLSDISVNASEAARVLFLKKGFSVVQRNELIRMGVAIHNYSMEKRFYSKSRSEKYILFHAKVEKRELIAQMIRLIKAIFIPKSASVQGI